MGRLTTHVLDTARGMPGAGIDIKLFSLEAGRHLVATATTNTDGRTDQPLLADETMLAGSYELEFAVADYFAVSGIPAGDPPFLGDIVLRFTIADGESYHVPLLVSPWSYSTYRGS
ncbi:MAG: hydroxyisourate hydrolase [Gammaproteobacteria bacterium]|nr:hydroxyisourate hydrolase [Gammaproteobacteria bacterium]